jgi:integrase
VGFNSIQPHIQLALLIADFTGMRQGEVLNMKWIDVDEINCEYLVPESKTDKKRTVPLHPELLKVLKLMPRNSEYVVSWKGSKIDGTLHNGLSTAFKAAGIEDFRFHDLRHRAITRWCQMGMPTNIIMAASGHRTTNIFLRYANIQGKDTQMLVGGKTNAIGTVSCERFMELYKKPQREPWVD